MEQLQPASNRALVPEDPTCCDKDEIGALLRHAFAEPSSEAMVAERWHSLAERIVADLQNELDQERMELHRCEVSRMGLVLRSWSSLTVRLA